MNPLPRDIEAESAALGSIILDYRVLDEVKDNLASAEDFYTTRHATIYHAICEVVEANRSLDMVMLTGKLNDMGVLKQIGGVEYLIDLFESVPSAASAGHYAARVAEKALRRRLIDQQEAMLKSLYGGDTPATSLIDSSINSMIEMRVPEKSHEGAMDVWMDEAMEDDRPRVNSGMGSLDDLVGGFELGTMTIIAANPSVGKTALGVCMALNMASHGLRVGFASAEMKGRRIARRMVCAHARVDTEHFEQHKRRGSLDPDIAFVRGLPLWINETSGIHIDKLCSQIRRWHREHDIQVVFVDYLQLITHGKDSEYEGVTHSSNRLKAVAQDLDISMFALAQLNRQNTQRQDKRPTMADIRGSGAVEQDADVIIMPHREGYHDPINGNQDEAELIVAKNRDGKTGTAHVGWIGKCGVFTSGIENSSVLATI